MRPAARGLMVSDGVPVCPQGCGFAGHPDEIATPYTNCGGRISAHQRPPLRGTP